MSDAIQELDALAEEYKKYGHSALISTGIFLAILGIIMVSALMQIPFHEWQSYSKNSPPEAVVAGIAGAVSAALAIVAIISGPVFILLLSKFLKNRTHYGFCKFAANFLSCYRLNRPMLIEKTLDLLRQESVRELFKR